MAGSGLAGRPEALPAFARCAREALPADAPLPAVCEAPPVGELSVGEPPWAAREALPVGEPPWAALEALFMGEPPWPVREALPVGEPP